jgi:hypothetical protein
MMAAKAWLRVGCGVVLAAGLAVGCEDASKQGGGGDFKPPVEAGKGGGDFKPPVDAGGGAADAALPEAVAKAKFEGAGVHLPRHGELGLTLVQAPEYYTKDNLFEIIDGGSEGYISYGVRQMAKASYKANEEKFKDELNVELYEFEPQWSAFGKFGRERSGCEKVEGVGENWCARKSDVILWKGAVMVKVQAYDDSPEAQAALVKVAKAVEAKLPGEATPPPFLGKFPAEGKEAGSGAWSPQAVFGFEGTEEVYMQGYRPAGEAYQGADGVVTLFVVDKKTPEGAKAVLEGIKTKFAGQEKVKASGGVKALEGVGEAGFWFDDGVGKQVVFVKGSFVGGGRDFKDEAAAKEWAGKLAGGL